MYNWVYPIGGRASTRFVNGSATEIFNELRLSGSRALYVHIPFCETICTFCPFVRAKFDGESIIDKYVAALLKEIELKARFKRLTDVPIGAIFFGGGTPSVLQPRHIRQIGQALRNTFDVSTVREFSFEFEVKSITTEKIAALKEIGVTHARFGLQTFSEEYRQLFQLTATLDQIYAAIDQLTSAFPCVSCDMLYGMNGQTEAELVADIEHVCGTKLKNVDFYPVNNLVTQRKLHRAFRAANKLPTTGLTKFYMRLLIREAMRNKGYLPHNGHGWVKVDADELNEQAVVTDSYSFVYHEHVLGYPNHDLLGFGTNAVSSFHNFVISNVSSRDEYMRSLAEGKLKIGVSEHSEAMDACRPVALALPYHGSIRKMTVDWPNLPPNTMVGLEELKKHELIRETEEELELTHAGWEWYTSLMYFLLPQEEQLAIKGLLRNTLRDSERDIEPSGLEYFPLSTALSQRMEATVAQ